MRRLIIALFLLGSACSTSVDPSSSDMSGSATGEVSEVTDTSDAAAEPDTSAPDMGPVDTGPVLPPALELPVTLGGDRPAVYWVPGNYDPTRSYPLIVLLHGFGANFVPGNDGGQVQNAYWGVSKLTMTEQFILIAPHGLENGQGLQYWNAHKACCDFDGTNPDDVGYLNALIDEAEAVLSVDTSRIYLIGHSNGAFMSYRMACETPERFAGIMALAGTATECDSEVPMPILHIHGDADDTILFEGDGNYIGAEATVQYYVDRNGCSPDPEAVGTRDLVTDQDGEETTVTRWSGCTDGATVELWRINGGEHIPALDGSFSLNAVQWLFQFSRE